MWDKRDIAMRYTMSGGFVWLQEVSGKGVKTASAMYRRPIFLGIINSEWKDSAWRVGAKPGFDCGAAMYVNLPHIPFAHSWVQWLRIVFIYIYIYLYIYIYIYIYIAGPENLFVIAWNAIIFTPVGGMFSHAGPSRWFFLTTWYILVPLCMWAHKKPW